jgi:hypothetical protein
LTTRRRQSARSVLQRAAWGTALLLALVILPACTNVAFPKEDRPTSGSDPAYGSLIAGYMKRTFKTVAAPNSFEISPLRWTNSMKGWSWLACVRFQDQGRRRTYAVFIKGSEILDSRYAVRIDACDDQTYSPFNLDTGAIGTIGQQDPLY